MLTTTKTRLAGLFILTMLAVWLVSTLSYYPGIVEGDTLGQYRLMQSGVYSNWKPALYEWQLFVGECIWKNHGLALAYVAQTVVMGCSMAWIVWHYTKKHYLYALGILGLPILLTTEVTMSQYIVNDYMATAVIILYIASVLAASERRHGLWRGILIVLATLSLFYGFALRHNAVFMVILLGYWGIGKLHPMRLIKRCVASLSMVIAFLVVSHCINAFFLQCEPSYPLRSAFADDIVNISTLGKKWEPVIVRNFDTEGHPPGKTLFVPEAGHWNGVISGTTQEDDLAERKKNYLIIRDGWVESVTSHPLRYLAIKCFFFQQFLFASRPLPWVCDLLHHYYPHTRIFMEDYSRYPSVWLCRQMLVISYIPLTAYIILIVTGLRVIFRRKRSVVPALRQESKDALYIIGASFLYTLSFFPFVLSVSEFRYYSISTALSYIGLSVLLISMVVAWVQKSRGKRETDCTK